MFHRRNVVLAGSVVVLVLAAGCGGDASREELALIQRCVADYEAACAGPSDRPGAPAAKVELSMLDWNAAAARARQPIGPEGVVETPTTRPGQPEQPTTRPGRLEQPTTRPRRPEHWSTRRGAAYEGDWLHSWGRDGKEIGPTLWDDTKATFTNPWALAGFAAAGAVGITVNATNCDNSVADHYTKRGSQLNTFWDMVGDVGGNPGTHFAVASAMYFAGLCAEDVKTYETSKTLINALAINGLTTLALKGMVRTRSPNEDPYGWPSGHTSSSFCFATVMCEAYGPWVGIPLLLGASYVGYERIDARNHDFSDVLSGALIGIAIGHAVAQNHKARILGFEIIPWADPARGAAGLAIATRF